MYSNECLQVECDGFEGGLRGGLSARTRKQLSKHVYLNNNSIFNANSSVVNYQQSPVHQTEECNKDGKGGMPNVRLLRVQRKHLFYLITIIIISLTYIQFLSYELLASESSRTPNERDLRSANNEPIDVVYTWVNGSEERFQRELQEYARKGNQKIESFSAQRFDDKDELKFSLRSIEKHMPWVRHIYIVTNGQIPSWLDLDNERVTIVTHSEIFEDARNLPTFSSPAIEANLHRIRGLSEKFIYFNDDVFLNADVFPEDFYTVSQGYNIYTAWFTQDCALNCPWNKLNNGRCDTECYNKACNYDINDCKEMENQLLASNGSSALPASPELFTLDNETLSEQIVKFNAALIKLSKLQRRLTRQNRMKQLEEAQFNENVNITEANNTHLSNDLFSASLLHTQMLLGRKFGYRSRRVIAHAPIMFNRKIMEEVQRFFQEDFHNTQRHRFRHEKNVQISFIYSYYLCSAQVYKNIAEIFDEFDTDESGTWSDREIRTLLTRIYALPLTYQVLSDFENMLINCTNVMNSEDLAKEQRHSTPEYERYVDSPLTVITKKMIVECPDLKRLLETHETIGSRPKYNHQLVKSMKYVSFNMFRSHLALGMHMLDGIRKTPKKFICINDDLDRNNVTRADNELLVSLLLDFFVSIFPKKSQFELSPSFRNKFARMDELRSWQNHQWLWRWYWDEEAFSAIFKILILIIVMCICYLAYYLMSIRILRNFFGLRPNVLNLPWKLHL